MKGQSPTSGVTIMLRIFGLLLAFALVSGCESKFQSYSGPEVTSVVVYKERRKLYLLSDQTILRSYDFELGFAPTGHKQFEGDGKTPEGFYYIDRRNPNSKFHLSVGINYPNDADRAYAEEMGQKPGGDIFIHGQKGPRDKGKGDWTWGCIAVTNKEIEDVYAMVRDGTPIQINP